MPDFLKSSTVSLSSWYFLNAKLVVSYANKELDEDERKNVIQKCQKMTLAVGDEEIDKLEKRYDSFCRAISIKDFDRLW